ncbi:cyclic di-GMP phosphodiesterase Gmr [mine drainage metagenome]|uniref:Cyclic di-GMP phosphodiesterase Gmr n=1 Tax=mine drainage metagenome TaxID=410659 RepID=A0A1J5RCP0_9ZZZZ
MKMKKSRNEKVEILIAEDSQTQLALLKHLLEKNGYEVVTAINGKEALALALQHNPALIISDIVMPELDGYGLCKAIKSDAKTRDIPVILVTTLSESQDVIHGLECGADNLVRKPYDERYLLSRIEYLLMNLAMHESQKMKMGIEILLGGRKYFITAERQQILDLLISTYEQAVHINDELKLRRTELEHSNQVLQGFGNIVAGLNHALGEREVAEAALERAMELPGIQAGWISLWEEESGFRLAAARNLPPALLCEGVMEGLCDCRRRFLAGELDHVTNIMECERLKSAKGDAQGLHYHASVPLWAGNRAMGIMNLVGAEQGLFDEAELDMLYVVGNQVAVALERARLHEHLEHLVEERTAALTAEIAERQRIQDAQARLVAIVEATPDLIGTAMPDGRLLYVNQAGLRLLGIKEDDFPKSRIQDFHPEWAGRLVTEEGIPHAVSHGAWSGETAILGPDGREIPVLQVILAHKGSDGTGTYLSTIVRDITNRKANEAKIMRLNRVYAVLSGINTTIVRTRSQQELFDEACRIAVEHGRFRMAWIGLIEAGGEDIMPMARAGFEDGYLDQVRLTTRKGAPDARLLVGRAIREKTSIVSNDIATDPELLRWREEALLRGYRSMVVFPLLREDKPVGVFVLYAVEANFFDSEEMTLLTEVAGDISFAMDHLEKAARLNYLAYYDVLTGLSNRTLLEDRITHAIPQAARSGDMVAILFIDLDRFKNINDSLGHSFGDAVLKHTAERLSGCIREVDTIARLGGDEFIVLLTGMGRVEDITVVVQKILETLASPFVIDLHEFYLTASIGISVYPKDGGDVEALLKMADAAMYRAKGGGRNRFEFFIREMNELASRQMLLEGQLRQALDRNELVVYYQAQADLKSGSIIGVEALLRWQHPELGTISPAEFIPIAEEAGLIVMIGHWVLESACRQAVAWQAAGLPKLRMGVNLSVRQFADNKLGDTVKRILQETGHDPELLDLELTESVLMQGAEKTIVILKDLRKLGISLSVDDFGTGYSSLSYLKRFPVTTVKIDQSFVRGITTDSDDATLVRSIIGMAHEMRLGVIAEGVETEGQLAFLTNHHCDEVQGYYLSRPLPADECAALLRGFTGLPPLQDVVEVPQRTLLLVDDEVNIATSLKRLLRSDGYRVLTATSGKEGLELLAVNQVGVIVSDQRMPEMTGVEFLRRVKGLYPETVRIVLSGYTELQSITDAINEGAIYKFLTKPWEDEQLREHIREAFQHYELKQENIRLTSEIEHANEELSEINRDLKLRVAEKAQEIHRNINVLRVSQEILEHLPAAVIGIDDDGVIVVANHQADMLFPDVGGGPLLGCEAGSRLPASFIACAADINGRAHPATLPDGRRVSIICHRMGEMCISSGTILVISLIDTGA